jgi:type IV pilus assembly protein PilA
MMVVLGIIALLALMSLPMFVERNIQQQVKDAIAFTEFMQKGVQAVYAITGVLPKDNVSAALPAPDKIIGNYVTSATVVNGAITITFGNLAAGSLKGKKITLRPGFVQDTPMVPLSWICASGKVPNGLTVAGDNATDLPNDWLPVACRA